MSYARRHSTNVCPGNRVRYRTKLGMALKELLPGGPQGQRGAAGYWNIPPLVDCRAHFGRLLGGKIDWQEPSRERLDF